MHFGQKGRLHPRRVVNWLFGEDVRKSLADVSARTYPYVSWSKRALETVDLLRD